MAVPDESDNLLQHVMDIASGFWRSQVLFSAIEVGLFTVIGQKGGLSEVQLTRELAVDGEVSRDFFDALVSVGLLSRDEDDLYHNSPTALALLDSRADDYVGNFLLFQAHALYPAWSRLPALVRTGRPQEGVDSFEEWYRDLDEVRRFMAAMDSASATVVRRLATHPVWRNHASFADLGGARGNLTTTIVEANPHLTGVCFDLPALEPLFDELAARTGDRARVSFHGGDFRTEPLPSTEVHVFGHVLHDWDPESRGHLVGRSFAALPSGGTILVYDELLDDDRRGPTRSLLMSLNMRLVRSGGSEYTMSEGVEMLTRAGFSDIRVDHLTRTERLLLGTKP